MLTNQLIGLLPDLASYILVVNEGSFTAAAKQLGVTPSALSKLITRLEQTLDIKLLERTTRRVRVTEAGQRIYEQSVAMVSAAKQAVEIAELERAEPSGVLTVAGPKAFLTHVLQPLITPFLRAYPAIELRLHICDGDIDIFARNIDVVFRLTDSPSERLVLKTLGKVRLVLCASPAYLVQRGTPEHPRDLAGHDCIFLAETESDNLWEFHQGDSHCSVPVRGRCAVNHSQMRLNAVLDDWGIGIFPDFVIRDAIADGRVVSVLDEWTLKGNYQGVVAMQYAQTRYLPARLRVFIDYVMRELKL